MYCLTSYLNALLYILAQVFHTITLLFPFSFYLFSLLVVVYFHSASESGLA